MLFVCKYCDLIFRFCSFCVAVVKCCSDLVWRLVLAIFKEIKDLNTYNTVQLTLEQHNFELLGSTYMQIFSMVNITLLHDPWLVEFLDVEPQIWRDLVYRRQTIYYTHISGCPKGQCPYPNVVQGSTVVYVLEPLLYE